MRNDRRENYRDRDNYREDSDARWLHGHHQGQNSARGNYTIDTHFNRGYGDNDYSQYGNTASFNTNADQRGMSEQGRFQPGGAHYTGDDYTSRRRQRRDNPYGMSYFKDDEYNSGRHYDARADYSDSDYDDLRRRGEPNYRYRMADERFGHDVRQGDDRNWARGSIGDYESYRRYEHKNPNYDNDYSGGFTGRNYARGEASYGEGSNYANLDRWEGRGDEQYERYMRERDRH